MTDLAPLINAITAGAEPTLIRPDRHVAAFVVPAGGQIKMGRKWKFKREQVDAWVEAGGAAANEARERDTDTEGRDG